MNATVSQYQQNSIRIAAVLSLLELEIFNILERWGKVSRSREISIYKSLLVDVK
jgi:hypothetical protein